MERKFEFQDFAAIGAVGTGLYIGLQNAKKQGIGKSDLKQAFKGSSILPSVSIPSGRSISNNEMSQFIDSATAFARKRNNKKETKVNDLLSERTGKLELNKNDLAAAKAALVEFNTSPEVSNIYKNIQGSEGIYDYVNRVYAMGEMGVREEYSRLINIGDRSPEAKRILGGILTRQMTGNSYGNIFSEQQAVYERSADPKVLYTGSANLNLQDNINDKVIRSISNLDPKSIEGRIAGNSFIDRTFVHNASSIDDLTSWLKANNIKYDPTELTSLTNKANGLVSTLASKGIVPNTERTFTVMGVPGLNKPAIYMNLNLGGKVTDAKAGYQLPLSRPELITRDGTSTPVYFRNRDTTSMTLLTNKVGIASNTPRGPRIKLHNPVDAIFYDTGSGVQKSPFFSGLVDSVNVILPRESDARISQAQIEQYAKENKVTKEQAQKSLLASQDGRIITANPLDSLFGNSSEQGKIGQNLVGTSADPQNMLLARIKGRQISIIRGDDVLGAGGLDPDEFFKFVDDQITGQVIQYGSKGEKFSIAPDARYMSPGQAAVGRGAATTIGFNIIDTEGMVDDSGKPLSPQAIKSAIASGSESLRENTHYGMFQRSMIPEGYNTSRRPTQPFSSPFNMDPSDSENLRASRVVFDSVSDPVFNPTGSITRRRDSSDANVVLNRRSLIVHPDVEAGTGKGQAADFLARMTEGQSVAIVDNVNPRMIGASRPKRINLPQDGKTLLNKRLASIVDILKVNPEMSEVERRAAIRSQLSKSKGGAVFKKGEELGLEMSPTRGLITSSIDQSGLDELILSDASIDGDSLKLDFRPVIKGLDTTKTFGASKTTQVAMYSSEAISRLGISNTGLDQGLIDAIIPGTEIARPGNFQNIRTQQMTGLIDILTEKALAEQGDDPLFIDNFNSKNEKTFRVRSVGNSNTAKVLREVSDLMTSSVFGMEESSLFKSLKTASASLVLGNRTGAEEEMFNFVQSHFTNNTGKVGNIKSTSRLVGTLKGYLTAKQSGIKFSAEEVFGIFGLERQSASGLAPGKSHTGLLGTLVSKMNDGSTVAKETLTMLSGVLQSSGMDSNTIFNELKDIGTIVNGRDIINNNFLRGQLESTIRSSSSLDASNATRMERRGVEALIHLPGFKGENSIGSVDFRTSLLTDLSMQLDVPTDAERTLATRLNSKDGILELAQENWDEYKNDMSVSERGKLVDTSFLKGKVFSGGKEVKVNPIYVPSIEEESILRQSRALIEIDGRTIDDSYMGKLDDFNKAVQAAGGAEGIRSGVDTSNTAKATQAYLDLQLAARVTAHSITSRVMTGEILGSIYTLNQASTDLVERDLKIADNITITRTSRDGGLIRRVNKNEAESLLNGARKAGLRGDGYKALKANLMKGEAIPEVFSRYPFTSANPRIFGLVQYDADLDYVPDKDGSHYRVLGQDNQTVKGQFIPVSEYKGSPRTVHAERFSPAQGNRSYLPSIYAEVDGKESDMSLYRLTNRTADKDGDYSTRNLYLGDDARNITMFLNSKSGQEQYMKYIVEENMSMERMKKAVEGSPRMLHFNSQAAEALGEKSADWIETAGKFSAQAEIGRVSTAISQLKVLMFMGAEEKRKGFEAAGDTESLNRLSQSKLNMYRLFEELEQQPISFKHLIAGASPAQVLASDITAMLGSEDAEAGIRALRDFFTGWTAEGSAIRNEVDEMMELMGNNAASYVSTSPEVKAALKMTTATTEKIAGMSEADFERTFNRAKNSVAISEAVQAHIVTSFEEEGIIEGNEELAALNKSTIERARERQVADLKDQTSRSIENSKGRAISKIAGPVGIGLAVAGLMYAMSDRGYSSQELQTPEQRNISQGQGAQMNFGSSAKDPSMEMPSTERDMGFAPNTMEVKSIGSSNTARINTRAQISQNVNALDVARTLQNQIPHNQIGVNLQYKYKMNPRLEQEL